MEEYHNPDFSITPASMESHRKVLALQRKQFVVSVSGLGTLVSGIALNYATWKVPESLEEVGLRLAPEIVGVALMVIGSWLHKKVEVADAQDRTQFLEHFDKQQLAYRKTVENGPPPGVDPRNQ